MLPACTPDITAQELLPTITLPRAPQAWPETRVSWQRGVLSPTKGMLVPKGRALTVPGLTSPARPQPAHALRPAAPTLCRLWKFQHLFRIPPRPLKSILLEKKKNIFRSLYVQNQKVINWTGCFLPTLSWSLLFYDMPNRRNSSI